MEIGGGRRHVHQKFQLCFLQHAFLWHCGDGSCRYLFFPLLADEGVFQSSGLKQLNLSENISSNF